MYLEELKRFGLSEKEALVYLALLGIEIGVASEIAKAAGINRSSTYVVLESLRKRGLVSVSAGVKKNTKYIVSPPEHLARLAGEKAKAQVEIRDTLEKILPDLKSLYRGTKQKPHVRIYEGKEGLIASFEEALSCKEKLMRVVSSSDDIQKTLPEYLPGYVKRRMQVGIKMRGIHPYSDLGEFLRQNFPLLDEIQLIAPERWNFISDFGVWDNTVAFMLHKELIAIHIDNSAVADGMKKIFDLAFEEAKRLDIKKLPKRSKAATP